MANNSIIPANADALNQLNDLLNDRMYILLFIVGDGSTQQTIFDKASKMFASTPNEYTAWIPNPDASIIQYLEANIRDFSRISSQIGSVAAFSVSMVGNSLVHVINIGEWNATDKLRIFQAYNACVTVL
ncbi:MAG: hypothetical protein SFW35_01795 [Chitinophagales bacterium]|nr:hypothetical protein [Chitinophagales bacterium]